ncbi:hypothetical protein [Sphaerisporangium krabiense]|uniref:Uncharacterized protein n=1 Tax=Sphaerisporangium krabiense TaxID=763782 RepID=A0A7W8Z0U5_9ACTN|nr:hypothetical protein [Sphaerisporangium krabiense]MBB5625398.1 hypothetical protein [Sphaerisporangium krabiense]
MRRRVFVRCGCLALVFLLAGFAVWWVRNRSPLYQSVVTVAFVTKTSHFAGEVYDHFTDNHIFTALATERFFDNPGTRDRLRAMGGTAKFSYEVAHWGNQELPVYGQPYATLQSLSSDPKESIDTLNLALKLLTQKLAALQTSAGANGRVMIKWEMIGSILGPQRQPLQKSRAIAGIGLSAMLVTVVVMRLTRDRSRDTPGRPSESLLMTPGTPRRPRPSRLAGTNT